MANITVDATNVRPLPGYIAFPADAGEAMAVGKVVQIVSDEDAEMANATSAAGVDGVLGIVTAGGEASSDGTIVNNERITIVTYGRVFLGVDAGLVEGSTYYVSTTDGVLTDVAPANYRAVGQAVSSTTLLVNPVTTVSGS